MANFKWDLFDAVIDPTSKTVWCVCYFCRVLFEAPCYCTGLKPDMLGRSHCEETRETPMCFDCMCKFWNGG